MSFLSGGIALIFNDFTHFHEHRVTCTKISLTVRLDF